MLDRPPLPEHVMKNVFFDTCVYHQPGIDLLFRVIDTDNILFASEMFGAVKVMDPETGHQFDDTKRYLDKLDISAAMGISRAYASSFPMAAGPSPITGVDTGDWPRCSIGRPCRNT